MRRSFLAAVFVLTATAAVSTGAQDTAATPGLRPTADGAIVQLKLRDGSSLLGRVIEVTPTTVRFASSVGESTIPRSAIKSVKAVAPESIHDGVLWPEDPSRTRLFFAPTGRMLRKGELYFADAFVFFPSLQGGLSDVVTVGAGASLFPGIGLADQLYYFTPKVGVYATPSLNIAVGALVAGARWATEQSPFGLGYGVATFGGENGGLTVGAGFAFSGGGGVSSQGVLMIGGQRRVSRNIALVTENYVVTNAGDNVGISAGVRFMGERLAVDLALVTGEGAPAAFPYVAFIYRW